MKIDLLNAWPMFVGRKPYGREFNIRHGAEFCIHIMRENAWLRVMLRVCSCTIMIVAIGHDVPIGISNKVRRDAYYFTVGVGGLFVTWWSREQDLLPPLEYVRIGKEKES